MKKSITIGCDLKFLPEIRKFIGDILSKNKLGEVESYKIILAVDEICANLIIHANNSDPSRQLDLSIDLIPLDRVTFTIKDRGTSFDFSQYKEPRMDEIVNTQRKGGLGLILVRRIMDDIEFTTEKNCNICRLVKKL